MGLAVTTPPETIQKGSSIINSNIIATKLHCLFQFCFPSHHAPLSVQGPLIPFHSSLAMRSFVEGAFSVEIKNMSLLLAQCQGNEALSKAGRFERMFYEKYGPFTLGRDNKFEIRAYPETASVVGIYVCLLSDANVVKKFSSMVTYYSPFSEKWMLFPTVNDKVAFKADTIGQGMGLPMLKVMAFTGEDWKKYNVLFKPILGLYLDDSEKVPSIPDSKVCSSDLSSALLNGEFADINFVVDCQTFAAHRAVLAARSSVFRSELFALQNDLCENGSMVSTRQPMDALTFKCLLHFIYTNSLPPDFDDATSSQKRYRSLFIAAHLFKIERLKMLCQEKLTSAATDCILSTLDVLGYQESGLLKVV